MDDGSQIPDTPEVPVGEWTGTEGLSADLKQPHGLQSIIADKRPDVLTYLPDTPDLDYKGAYVYLAAIYPIVGMEMTLWEYYYSQSDTNLRPHTYITDFSPIEVYGTLFHTKKESHRLHWHGDRDALIKFLGFLQTLIIKHDAKRRIWALALHEIQIPYPKDHDKRSITCVVVLPYNHVGAFVPTSDVNTKGAPVIAWVGHDNVMEYKLWCERQDALQQAELAAKGGYLGERAQPRESYIFYKAPEIKATIDLLWGKQS